MNTDPHCLLAEDLGKPAFAAFTNEIGILYLEPTIRENCSGDSPLMQDEISGPFRGPSPAFSRKVLR